MDLKCFQNYLELLDILLLHERCKIYNEGGSDGVEYLLDSLFGKF